MTLCVPILLLAQVLGAPPATPERPDLAARLVAELPDGLPEKIALLDLDRSFGLLRTTQLLVHAPPGQSILDAEFLRRLECLTAELENLPGVQQTLSPMRLPAYDLDDEDADAVRAERLLEASCATAAPRSAAQDALLRRRLEALPQVRNTLLAADLSAVSLVCVLSSEASPGLAEHLAQRAAAYFPAAQVGLLGAAAVRQEALGRVHQDAWRWLPLGGLLAALASVSQYRRRTQPLRLRRWRRLQPSLESLLLLACCWSAGQWAHLGIPLGDTHLSGPPSQTSWLQHGKRLAAQSFDTADTLLVDLQGDLLELPALKRLEALTKQLLQLPAVSGSSSVVDVLSAANRVLGGGAGLPQTTAQARTLMSLAGSDPAVDQLLDRSGRRGLLILRLRDGSPAARQSIQASLAQFEHAQGTLPFALSLHGMGVLHDQLTDALQADLWRLLAYGGALLGGLAGLCLRRVRRAAAAASIPLAALLLSQGILTACGQPLLPSTLWLGWLGLAWYGGCAIDGVRSGSDRALLCLGLPLVLLAAPLTLGGSSALQPAGRLLVLWGATASLAQWIVLGRIFGHNPKHPPPGEPP
jgi:hypothetical protein